MAKSKSEAPPATLGGTGWRPREAHHRAELGELWHACGVGSEVATLREVVLTWPGAELDVRGAPNDWLMLDRIDVSKIRDQARQIEAFFIAQGVVVQRCQPSRPAPPNLIFMRDLFLMTPEGAIVGRMAAAQRAGEERFAAQALADIGIPILGTLHGAATFEGADALWLEPTCVVLGVGRRTNRAGAQFVTRILADLGVRVRTVPMPDGVQHLLGIANPIARDLVAVRADKASDELTAILREHGYDMLRLAPDAEVTERRAMNFVTLGPRRLVMPANCPNTRQRYCEAGIAVSELEISEYLKAAGGLGCLTGIVRRADAPDA